MKVVEKITLVIYSNIILILSIIACLLVFRWLDINVVGSLMAALLLGETSSKIILGVSIVFILLSVFISCEQFVNIVRNISSYYINYIITYI